MCVNHSGGKAPSLLSRAAAGLARSRARISLVCLRGGRPRPAAQPFRHLPISPPHLLALLFLQLRISDAAAWTPILSPKVVLRAATDALAYHYSYAELCLPRHAYY